VTRLPVDSWDVRPRFDIPPYELNTICPITGETSGLEDHHIFRRSFTGLGEANKDLFWVEYLDREDNPHTPVWVIVKNRVNLSSEAHYRITINRARLEYRGEDLWYIEDGEERKLDLNLRLMEGSEKISKPRRAPKATTPEERKARATYAIRTPKDEENVLPELEEALRGHLEPQLAKLMNDPSKASSYWVWLVTAKVALES
jgi:hypothetical protein